MKSSHSLKSCVGTLISFHSIRRVGDSNSFMGNVAVTLSRSYDVYTVVVGPTFGRALVPVPGTWYIRTVGPVGKIVGRV